MEFIPYGRQNIDQNDINSVVEVLQSDWLTQGPVVKAFEDKIKSYCESKFAFAVCNATAALHLAYLVLGVGEGDTVWTSPNTFLSTANAALMCSAQVDFVDICPKTYNMSAEALDEKLQQADRLGCLPKVVVPVHFAGQPCEMKKIHQLSIKYGFKIVEDAAHAIGARYLGNPVGNCQFSDITVFSFHPVKIITTGEGGALTTNNPLLAERINLLRAHGMTRDETLMDKPSEGAWYYQMLDLGFNYRITDLQCALGISQLDKLDKFIETRHKFRARYEDLLINCLEVDLPYQSTDGISALHLFPITTNYLKRKTLFDFLRTSNIGVNVHYMPVYLQPYYLNKGFQQGYCPCSEHYYNSAISLPIHPSLSENQIDFIVSVIQEGLRYASGNNSC